MIRNSQPAILLRESYREKGKVKTRTLANLSKLPPESIDILRRSLKGENLDSCLKRSNNSRFLVVNIPF